MGDFLRHIILDRSEIFQNKWILLSIAAVAVIILLLILFIILRKLKKRKLGKTITIDIGSTDQYYDLEPQKNYQPIVKKILQLSKKTRTILFASVGQNDLPVTLLVNVSVGLAKSGKQCLLIDVDLRNDAIAKAFELKTQTNELLPHAIPTRFDNLSVWPANNFIRTNQMNLKEIAQKAIEKFDIVIISAPALTSSCDRQQITSSAHAAFICTKNDSEKTSLANLIKQSTCQLIGHIRPPT